VFLIDLTLFTVNVGIGWLIWSVVTWANGQTPGGSLLGTRSRDPSSSPRNRASDQRRDGVLDGERRPHEPPPAGEASRGSAPLRIAGA
jgi:hypothetical protein